MSNWYYMSGNQEVGPIPSSVVKQLAASGTIRCDTLIRQDTANQWSAASKLKGLSFPPPPPPVPAPRAAVKAPQDQSELRSREQFANDSVLLVKFVAAWWILGIGLTALFAALFGSIALAIPFVAVVYIVVFVYTVKVTIHMYGVPATVAVIFLMLLPLINMVTPVVLAMQANERLATYTSEMKDARQRGA